MKSFCVRLTVLLIVTASSIKAEALKPDMEIKVAEHIDKLVSQGLAAKGLKANPVVSDEVFLKRVYLDIVGRIPTLDEYEKFIGSSTADKRSKLVDALHDSPGYISHSFNYWADALRARTKMNKATGENYLHWVKKSIAENKPYNEFVHEMISSEGNMYKDGNGAVGYYMRDHMMPLDNLANTMQLFLATSMVCAQCHDHPYKKWTQMEFFQLAAFNNGTQTNTKGIDKKTDSQIKKFMKTGKKDDANQKSKPLRPLFQGVYNSGTGKIKLPSDYDYDDAKPNQEVKAGVPYGPQLKLNYDSSNGAQKRTFEFRFDKGGFAKNINSRKYFADWITSPENPMFTKTIVNRLWHRVMGVVLVDDLTDMKESEMGPNPDLTKFLLTLMKRVKYDQKAFMKAIFKTKTYQRTASKEIKGKYYFQGPVMKRISAEQLWDSLISLKISNPDKNSAPPEFVTSNIVYKQFKQMTPKQMAAFLNNPKSIKVDTKAMMRGSSGSRKGKDTRRASELRSPSEVGSMLRTYGQSSREIIDDASTEANIPQALTMMNDASLSLDNTILANRLKSEKNMNKKIEMVYKTVLSRKPTSAEMDIMKRYISKGLKIEDIYWSLLNSHEFKLRM